MTAVTITLICLAAALACALLRPVRPELAMGIALAGGIAALIALREELATAARLIWTLAGQTELPGEHTALLLRASGIALVCEFGADLCRDAGESALAGRIDLCARVVLLAMAAPLIQALVQLVLGLLRAPAG